MIHGQKKHQNSDSSSSRGVNGSDDDVLGKGVFSELDTGQTGLCDGGLVTNQPHHHLQYIPLALNICTVVRLLMLPAFAATPAFILAYSNCSGFGSFQTRWQNCEK
jgi:hypothetical protein